MYISRDLLVVLVTCASGVVAVAQGPVEGPQAAIQSQSSLSNFISESIAPQLSSVLSSSSGISSSNVQATSTISPIQSESSLGSIASTNSAVASSLSSALATISSAQSSPLSSIESASSQSTDLAATSISNVISSSTQNTQSTFSNTQAFPSSVASQISSSQSEAIAGQTSGTSANINTASSLAQSAPGILSSVSPSTNSLQASSAQSSGTKSTQLPSSESVSLIASATNSGIEATGSQTSTIAQSTRIQSSFAQTSSNAGVESSAISQRLNSTVIESFATQSSNTNIGAQSTASQVAYGSQIITSFSASQLSQFTNTENGALSTQISQPVLSSTQVALESSALSSTFIQTSQLGATQSVSGISSAISPSETASFSSGIYNSVSAGQSVAQSESAFASVIPTVFSGSTSLQTVTGENTVTNMGEDMFMPTQRASSSSSGVVSSQAFNQESITATSFPTSVVFVSSVGSVPGQSPNGQAESTLGASSANILATSRAIEGASSASTSSNAAQTGPSTSETLVVVTNSVSPQQFLSEALLATGQTISHTSSTQSAILGITQAFTSQPAAEVTNTVLPQPSSEALLATGQSAPQTLSQPIVSEFPTNAICVAPIPTSINGQTSISAPITEPSTESSKCPAGADDNHSCQDHNQGGNPTRTGNYGLTFAPRIECSFNFYNGSIFDPKANSMTSSENRIAQSQAVNAALPVTIQDAFNQDSIDYYDPGTGDFYYAKHCNGDNSCVIIQAAKSCDCYKSANDGQLHNLNFNDGEATGSHTSVYNSKKTVPGAAEYGAEAGETIFIIAENFGLDLAAIQTANRDIDPSNIYVSQTINIPAQAYTVEQGDNLRKIAKKFGLDLFAIESLNPKIRSNNDTYPGKVIQLPATRQNTPFVYIVRKEDSFYKIAQKYKTTVEQLEALNPGIADINSISVGQKINVPVFLPTQGYVTLVGLCDLCQRKSHSHNAKFARAMDNEKKEPTMVTIEVGPSNAPIVAPSLKSFEVRDSLLPDPEHPSKPWVGHWRSAQIAREQKEKEKADKKQKHEEKKKKHDVKKNEHEDKKNGVKSAVDAVESGIVPRAAVNTSISTPTLSSVTEPAITSASSSLWHKFFGKKTEAEKEEAAKKRQEKNDAAKKADEDWEEDYKKQRHEDFLSELSVLFNPKTKKPQARDAATINSIPFPTSSKNLSKPAVTAPSSALLAQVDGKKSAAQLKEEKNRPKQPYLTANSNLYSQDFSKIVTRAVDVGMEKRAPALTRSRPPWRRKPEAGRPHFLQPYPLESTR